TVARYAMSTELQWWNRTGRTHLPRTADRWEGNFVVPPFSRFSQFFDVGSEVVVTFLFCESVNIFSEILLPHGKTRGAKRPESKRTRYGASPRRAKSG